MQHEPSSSRVPSAQPRGVSRRSLVGNAKAGQNDVLPRDKYWDEFGLRDISHLNSARLAVKLAGDISHSLMERIAHATK